MRRIERPVTTQKLPRVLFVFSVRYGLRVVRVGLQGAERPGALMRDGRAAPECRTVGG